MNIFSYFVLFLLFSRAANQFVNIPKGVGFIENKRRTKKRCIDYELEIKAEEDDPFCLILSDQCKTSEKTREKRSVAAIALVVAGISFAGWIIHHNELHDIKEQLNYHRQSIEALANATDDLNKNANLTWIAVQNVTKHVQKQEIQKVLTILFNQSRLEQVMKFFSQNPRDVLELFEYDDRFSLDLLKKMKYEFKCGAASNKYVLEICDTWNPLRRFGEVKMTAPVGGFVNDGTAYRYFDSPTLNFFVAGKIVPTGECEQMGPSEWSCDEPKGDCSLVHYERCELITEITPNGVFSIDLDDATYISTTEKHYTLIENGETSFKDVPATGSFIFVAPHNATLKIGGKEFHGRHDRLHVQPVAVFQEFPGLTHKEVDEIEKRFEKIGTSLEKLKHLKKVRHSISWGSTIYDFFAYIPYFVENYLERFIVGAALIVFIVGAVWVRRRCCKKKKKSKRDPCERL